VPDPNSVPRNCRFPISCNRYTLHYLKQSSIVSCCHCSWVPRRLLLFVHY